MVGAIVVVIVVVGSIVVVGADVVLSHLHVGELDSGNSFGTSNFGLVAINTIIFVIKLYS